MNEMGITDGICDLISPVIVGDYFKIINQFKETEVLEDDLPNIPEKDLSFFWIGKDKVDIACKAFNNLLGPLERFRLCLEHFGAFYPNLGVKTTKKINEELARLLSQKTKDSRTFLKPPMQVHTQSLSMADPEKIGAPFHNS